MNGERRRKIYGKGGRSRLVVLFLILLWSVSIGWLIAPVTNVLAETPQIAPQVAQGASVESIGTVDIIGDRYKLGQEVYLENCATCHIALPPQVLPTETWRQLLQDPEHYGQQIRLLVDPSRLLVWNYLQTYSRLQPKNEEVPYRVIKSRYFKALHPRVKIPETLNVSSCVTCHPGASQYNFRKLTSEWINSP
ncbi:diheme cytochrome C [Oscillatoriales cyanobacterium USR001]|nr:diheme cytochrome C [Oscillatoriales cyanobacterium USR001]